MGISLYFMKNFFHHENTKFKTRSAGAPAAPALARRVRRVSTKLILFLFRVFILSCFRD
jgi:hypothetical protein